jgi:hypothetical protein
MANNQITAVEQFVFGAFIVVGIGVLAYLDKVLDNGYIWAAIGVYAATGVAYGVYLMENSTAIHSYWKYLAIIVASVVGYALTLWANNYITGLTQVTDPVLIAGFVVVVANFALNDLQNYISSLPDNVVTDATLLIGLITVAAQAVSTAKPGSIVNVQELLLTAIPAVMVYLFQKIPWTPPAPTTASKTPA